MAGNVYCGNQVMASTVAVDAQAIISCNTESIDIAPDNSDEKL